MDHSRRGAASGGAGGWLASPVLSLCPWAIHICPLSLPILRVQLSLRTKAQCGSRSRGQRSFASVVKPMPGPAWASATGPEPAACAFGWRERSAVGESEMAFPSPDVPHTAPSPPAPRPLPGLRARGRRLARQRTSSRAWGRTLQLSFSGAGATLLGAGGLQAFCPEHASRQRADRLQQDEMQLASVSLPQL